MSNHVRKISRINLQDFSLDPKLLNDSNWLFVVKSQDQTIRRNRLISKMQGGKFGRTESRPTAIGLLAKAQLSDGEAHLQWQKEFHEPRHIIQLEENSYALTDVNSIKLIDGCGAVKQTLTDPLFAFLHSIQKHSVEQEKLLICSSGYDAIIETNVKSGQRSFLWAAWENGFNPDEDGNWLCLTSDYEKKIRQDGKNAILINPNLFGEQGINTKFRSAHPNVAVYNPYKKNTSMIVSIGHGGTLYEVSLDTFESKIVLNDLAEMPHGLCPYENGWLVTNTTKGEIWFLSHDFVPEKIISFEGLSGKPKELGEIEWIQNTKVTSNGVFLALDANRGLIAFDIVNEKINFFQPNLEWCLQDAIAV